ncbi:MAG TPA: peroxidase-related enzyme [Candidatus Thermoplasmatota archaeon]|nr:peroxidase-related enzyme [Candidatus Thermoplasmatota archaeon]
MPWIEIVNESDAVGPEREAYEAVTKRRGALAHIWQVQGLLPGALTANLDLYEALAYREQGLSRREREMMGLVVAKMLNGGYAFTHHADALGRHVSEPGLVARVAGDWHQAPITPRERAILGYATKLTESPSTVTERDVEVLREAGLSDDQILEACLLTGYYNLINRVALGLGVERDDAAAPYRY